MIIVDTAVLAFNFHHGLSRLSHSEFRISFMRGGKTAFYGKSRPSMTVLTPPLLGIQSLRTAVLSTTVKVVVKSSSTPVDDSL